MMSGTPFSRDACTRAITTPECTVPTRTSALSRFNSRFTFCGAAAGSDASSSFTTVTGRPPSMPPRSARNISNAWVMLSPSCAKVPE